MKKFTATLTENFSEQPNCYECSYEVRKCCELLRHKSTAEVIERQCLPECPFLEKK